MISTDTIVKDPEEIKVISEVEAILSRIVHHEIDNRCQSGVLLTQRRQFGSLHEVISEDEAYKELKTPVKCNLPEFGVAYYPRTYFEALRRILEGYDIKLPKPIRRQNY